MGMRGQYRNKRDANEADIVAQLRAHGFSVVHLDKPVDLVCGYGGRTYLVEVKMEAEKMTEPQAKFFALWRGNKTVLRTLEDADELADEVKAEVNGK